MPPSQASGPVRISPRKSRIAGATTMSQRGMPCRVRSSGKLTLLEPLRPLDGDGEGAPIIGRVGGRPAGLARARAPAADRRGRARRWASSPSCGAGRPCCLPCDAPTRVAARVTAGRRLAFVRCPTLVAIPPRRDGLAARRQPLPRGRSRAVPAFLVDAATRARRRSPPRPAASPPPSASRPTRPSCSSSAREWDGVGAYRRALSSFDVKVNAVPLLSAAIDEPSAYELVAPLDPRRPHAVAASGLAADAGAVGLGRRPPRRAVGDVMSDFANLADAGRRLGPRARERAGRRAPTRCCWRSSPTACRWRSASARRSTLAVRGAAGGAVRRRRRHRAGRGAWPGATSSSSTTASRPEPSPGGRDRPASSPGVASRHPGRAGVLAGGAGDPAAPLRPGRVAGAVRSCTAAWRGTTTTST